MTNDRFNWHKTYFENSRKYGFYQIFSDHFHKGVSNNAPYIVKILENLDANGRTACDIQDASLTSKRKRKEKEWMLKLRAVFLMDSTID